VLLVLALVCLMVLSVVLLLAVVMVLVLLQLLALSLLLLRLMLLVLLLVLLVLSVVVVVGGVVGVFAAVAVVAGGVGVVAGAAAAAPGAAVVVVHMAGTRVEGCHHHLVSLAGPRRANQQQNNTFLRPGLAFKPSPFFIYQDQTQQPRSSLQTSNADTNRHHNHRKTKPNHQNPLYNGEERRKLFYTTREVVSTLIGGCLATTTEIPSLRRGPAPSFIYARFKCQTPWTDTLLKMCFVCP